MGPSSVKARYAVALVVGEPLRSEINGLRRATGGSITRIEPHITLVPPINLRNERLPKVLAHLRDGATLIKSHLTLDIGPVESFYPVNRVLYLVVQLTSELVRLQSYLNQGPLKRRGSATHSIARSERPFVPHITLNNRFGHENLPHQSNNQPGDAGTQIRGAIGTLASYQSTTSFLFLSLLCFDTETKVWRTVADAAFGRRVVIGQGGLGLEITTSTVVDPETQVWLAGLHLKTDFDAATVGNQPHLVITARRENQVAGVAIMAKQDTVGWLEFILVDPSKRRQGIGRALHQQSRSVALSHGIEYFLPAAPGSAYHPDDL